jgi:hypothetical protein
MFGWWFGGNGTVRLATKRVCSGCREFAGFDESQVAVKVSKKDVSLKTDIISA